MTLRRAHDEAVAERRVYVVSFNNGAIPNTLLSLKIRSPARCWFSAACPGDGFIALSGVPDLTHRATHHAR